MPTFHKYGFHVNRTGDDVFDAIRRLKPRVIKTLEHDMGFWTRVREIHPDVFLIGRQFVPNIEQDQFVGDPQGTGRRFADRILSLPVNSQQFNGRPLFDAWESYNEVMPGHVDDDKKRKYDDFQVAFGEKIKAGGFHPVAMNFATGNMRGEDFLNFFPGTLETYTYLGFHEYDWPDMWRLHKENIEQKNEGGMFLCLRYRRVLEWEGVHARYGRKHIAVITECGMTQGVQGRHDVGPWHESQPISEDQYWKSLLWYNHELMKDDYVLGACLFVVGAVTPWHSFEHLGGIMNRLEQLDRHGPDQPIPQPVKSTATAPSRPEAVQPVTHTQPPAQPVGGATPELRQALLTAGEERRILRFNPNAALQKRIFADNFVPNSPEFPLTQAGMNYVAQCAEHLGTGEVRIYYVKQGQWDAVEFVRREVRQRGETSLT